MKLLVYDEKAWTPSGPVNGRRVALIATAGIKYRDLVNGNSSKRGKMTCL